ncbi:AMP-binding protein [Leucobacter sp. M11]|uniref:AMP-binding protein n=1 Tax=Leucobacter sp. M11 TaxID=2993565 RepID=UPI002D7EFA18|nr:AMP-binding protein [Leucobacter sp. M11]MEB4613734.1 AMP-binding protein [Leucobacter sp. M11]
MSQVDVRAEIFGLSGIDVSATSRNTAFHEMGLSSLDTVALVVRIEDRLEASIPYEKLSTVETLGDLEDLVSEIRRGIETDSTAVLNMFACEDERTARALSNATTIGQQLEIAVQEHPDLILRDDRSCITLAEMWHSLDRVREEICTRDADAPCVIRPANDLQGIAQLLAALSSGLTPLVLVPSADETNLDALRQAVAEGNVPSNTALFLTTGGTTGTPKIIPRSHSSYLQTAWLTSRNAELTDSDAYLTALSIAHNYALACPGVLGAILSGASVGVTESRRYQDVVGQIERHAATVLPVVPSMPRQWAGHKGQKTSALRLVQVGGSPVIPTDVSTLNRLFSCQVQTSFGMAEGLLAQSSPEDGDDMRLAGIGRMLSIDDDYRIVDARPDGAGALELRGPYTITQYIASGEVNATKFTPDGWLRTGDLAVPVDDHRFRVLSRADDMINRGGELIDPASVEALVGSHPSVRGVVVLGRPHPLYEQIVQAVVELDPGQNSDAVMQWLRTRYPNATTLPDALRAVRAIPRTPMGKTDTVALRAELGFPPSSTPGKG